jgi:hypothetical protein
MGRPTRLAVVFTILYVVAASVTGAMAHSPESFGFVLIAYLIVANAVTWVTRFHSRWYTPASWILIPVFGVVFLFMAPRLWSWALILDRLTRGRR